MGPLVERLETGYREMLGLYEQLLVSGNSMAKHLEVDGWEAVSQELCAKQAIMDKIDEREKKLSELRLDLQKHMGLEIFSLSALEERFPATVLGNTLRQLMGVIEKLQVQEQDNEERLRQMVDGVQLQMEDLQKTKRAAKAYQPGSSLYGDARFVDETK